MKTFRLFAVLAFAAIFSVSAFAQTTAAPFKIGVINISAFDDEKEGITSFVKALNTLDAQNKPDEQALQTMANRLQALQTEIEGLQKQLSDPNPKVPIDRDKLQATMQAKYDEGQKLQLEYEYKKKAAEASAQQRAQTISGPVQRDIGNALDEYRKQKGYAMILDITKAYQMILAWDQTYDVTKDFIAFYNARAPKTAAVTAPPK